MLTAWASPFFAIRLNLQEQGIVQRLQPECYYSCNYGK